MADAAERIAAKKAELGIRGDSLGVPDRQIRDSGRETGQLTVAEGFQKQAAQIAIPEEGSTLAVKTRDTESSFR